MSNMASPGPRILRMNTRISDARVSELGRNYLTSFYSENPASPEKSLKVSEDPWSTDSANNRPVKPAPKYASPQKYNMVASHQRYNTASHQRYNTASQSKACSSMPQRRHGSTVATQCLSCDIDGTIANINARLELAKRFHPKPNERYWDVVLDGSHYNLDTPILPARAFLKQWIKGAENGNRETANRVIVYVSGRRSGTEEQTRNWLQEHDFPPGEIIHRVKGVKSGSFKKIELNKLKRSYNVVAHLGDRDDDQWASSCAGVRFVRCVDGYWLTKDEVHEQRLGDFITIVRKEDTENEIAEI